MELYPSRQPHEDEQKLKSKSAERGECSSHMNMYRNMSLFLWVLNNDVIFGRGVDACKTVIGVEIVRDRGYADGEKLGEMSGRQKSEDYRGVMVGAAS